MPASGGSEQQVSTGKPTFMGTFLIRGGVPVPGPMIRCTISHYQILYELGEGGMGQA